jgi:hypothetical protein
VFLDLVREARAGRRVVVVVDEAQNLEDAVLEAVRMLSNFEIPGMKLIQIVLAGQPQLADRLADRNLDQLRQRISILARLTQFGTSETANYVIHRLRVAAIRANPCSRPRRQQLSTLAAKGYPGISTTSASKEVVEDLDIKTLGSNSSNEWPCGCVEPGQLMAQNGDLAYPKWTGQAAVSSIADSRSKISAESNVQDDCRREKPSADNGRWSAEKWTGGMTHEQEC